MAIALIAAAILAQSPTALPTTRALYDECRLYVTSQTARAANGNEGPEEGLLCELVAFGLVHMNANGAQPRFCTPPAVEDSRESSVHMARVYLAYFEENADVRDVPEGETVFRLALARKWPCPD